MIQILLIAGNFMRENRWPLLTLLVYVAVFGGAMAFMADASLDDTLFFLRSVGVYGLAFTGLMAASAINNERRTRRMLAVLSKGIERSQYLTGLLLGVMFNAGIYCAAVGAIGTLALARHGQPAGKIWELVGVLMASFLLAGSAALFFSTFLHPLMAAAAAGITLATLGAAGRVLGPPWAQVLPAYTLTDAMISFGLQAWRVPLTAAAWAAVHSILFWMLAAMVFARRDIAVAIE
jgi:ABC-type transport system involved in multi-copper enzyme maturation permease subunit